MIKLVKRKKVLFSDRFGWEMHIRLRVNSFRFIPSFSQFEKANLDDYDILIPQALDDIVYIQEKRPDLNRNKCFVPPLEALDLCNDKIAFNDFMTANGYGEMIPKMGGELSLPYILKKRIDEYGSRSRIIKSATEEKIFRKFITSDDYYCQECISGREEHSTHILMVDGKIVYHRTLCFPFDDPLFVKGIGCKPKARGYEVKSNHIATFEAILNSFHFEGICCFDYKLVDDALKIFEINPRYGGSLTRSLWDMMSVYTAQLGDA